MRTLLLTAVLAASSCCTPGPWSPSPTTFAGVGKVWNAGYVGTGFAVRHVDNGFLVLTAKHNLFVPNPVLSFQLGDRYYADVREHWRAPGRADLALLLVVSDDRPETLPLASGDPEAFSRGWLAGYPVNVPVLHVAPIVFQANRTRFAGFGATGGSGSPLLNDRGEVVGVFTAIWRLEVKGKAGPDIGELYHGHIGYRAPLGPVLEFLR